MAQQIKFYATTSASYDALVASESVNGAGIYFVEGGELYKGTSRFGLGRVTVASSTEGVVNPARGDIVVTGEGAGWVYDGINWQLLGGDIGTIESSWQADISAAVDALVSTFTTGDAAGQVKLGDTNATVSGWSTLVGSVSTNATTIASVSERVTAIEDIVDASNSKVTATTGSFSNLTVDTATFNATTVSAGTLTVGGSDISDLISAGADARIAASTTTTVRAAATAEDTLLPTEKAVRTAIDSAVSNLAGAMHFRGTATITKSGETITVSNFSETFTPAGGDVVVDTTNNLEAVYTGSTWELLGSNSVYALDAYAPGTETVTAGATTLGGAVHAIAAQVDTLTASVATLASAVTGGNDDDGSDGVNVSVAIASETAAPTVTVTVTKATLNTTLGTTNVADKTVATSIGATGADTALATEKAVRDAITEALVWYDASGAVIA